MDCGIRLVKSIDPSFVASMFNLTYLEATQFNPADMVLDVITCYLRHVGPAPGQLDPLMKIAITIHKKIVRLLDWTFHVSSRYRHVLCWCHHSHRSTFFYATVTSSQDPSRKITVICHRILAVRFPTVLLQIAGVILPILLNVLCVRTHCSSICQMFSHVRVLDSFPEGVDRTYAFFTLSLCTFNPKINPASLKGINKYRKISILESEISTSNHSIEDVIPARDQ